VHAAAVEAIPALGLSLAVLCCACSEGEDGNARESGAGSEAPKSGEPTGSGEQGAEVEGDDARCTTGCEATLAAACSSGPPSMQVCVDDCNEFAVGACAAQYEAFIACADGQSVSCDPSGFPAVSACPGEQASFIQCINQ
jgi:hypothetical protein